ncbi:MAG: hypothetical protein ABIS92_07775 [Polyangia bacterium]
MKLITSPRARSLVGSDVRTAMLVLPVAVALFLSLAGVRTAAAQTATQIKVACLGEASTHSAHRMYDPEYPELMGMLLDSDFKKDASPQNPLDGGMLYGGGTKYRIGNFGITTGRVVETNLSDPQSVITSRQLKDAEAWNPHIVILGPFGPHEALQGGDVTTFLPALRRLVTRVVAFPSKPTVYIALPLPRWGMDEEANRRRFNMETAQVIRETGLPSIDFWTSFLGKMPEFADQNHLNLVGRKHMADVAFAVIKEWKPGQGAGGAGGNGGGGTGGSTGGSGIDGGASDGSRTGDGAVASTGGSAPGSTGGSGEGSGGVPGTGGTVGTGGAVGTGGIASSGGAVGTGGAANPRGTGGAPGSAGAAPTEPGGACTAGGPIGSAPEASVVLLVLATLILLARRRAAPLSAARDRR